MTLKWIRLNLLTLWNHKWGQTMLWSLGALRIQDKMWRKHLDLLSDQVEFISHIIIILIIINGMGIWSVVFFSKQEWERKSNSLVENFFAPSKAGGKQRYCRKVQISMFCLVHLAVNPTRKLKTVSLTSGLSSVECTSGRNLKRKTSLSRSFFK